MTDDNPQIHLELYVQSLAPTGSHQRQDDVLRQLRRLGATDTVTTDVAVWGKRLKLDGVATETRAGEAILHTIERLERWAGDTQTSLEPFFEVREVDPLIGESYRVRTLPRMCLSVTADGVIQQVYPCRRGGRTYRVEDFLDAFDAPEDGDPCPTVSVPELTTVPAKSE